MKQMSSTTNQGFMKYHSGAIISPKHVTPVAMTMGGGHNKYYTKAQYENMPKNLIPIGGSKITQLHEVLE